MSFSVIFIQILNELLPPSYLFKFPPKGYWNLKSIVMVNVSPVSFCNVFLKTILYMHHYTVYNNLRKYKVTNPNNIIGFIIYINTNINFQTCSKYRNISKYINFNSLCTILLKQSLCSNNHKIFYDIASVV